MNIDVANAVSRHLTREGVEAVVWDQQILLSGDSIPESLSKHLDAADFGVFIIPNDVKRGRLRRDNVVFALGLFGGLLGKQRCFVFSTDEPHRMKLPTELVAFVGANVLTLRSDWAAAVEPYCEVISTRIKELGARTPPASPVHPSPRTADTAVLRGLVQGALETVCRAVSVPATPESAGLRVFILRCDGTDLICTHYWAPNPVNEEVGLRVELTDERKDWAVFRAVAEKRVTLQDVQSNVQARVADTIGVSRDIACVLAAPILRDDHSVWGLVDLDASSAIGIELLRTEVAWSTLYQLARHLNVIFSLEGG